MSEELKPCPFCGEKARLHARDGVYAVRCSDIANCDASIEEWHSKDGVINMWNTRPIEGAKDDRIENLEKALHRIAQWAEAYPLDILPEPDFKRAEEVLQEAGMGISSISASNMRHVVEGVGKIAKEALRGGNER